MCPRWSAVVAIRRKPWWASTYPRPRPCGGGGTAPPARLRAPTSRLPARTGEALSEPVQRYMFANPIRDLVPRGRKYQLWVDRYRALYGSWYEMFQGSTGGIGEYG